MTSRVSRVGLPALCLVVGMGCGGAVTGGVPADGGASTDGGDPGDGGVPGALCDYTPPAGPDRTLPPMDDPRSARQIYDEFFGQYLPAYQDFGWEDAPWITYDWVESHHFPTPAAGLDNEIYHALFDFNPYNFERPGLAGLAHDDDNDTLFAADPDTVHRTYDPTEWMPAVASTYTRSATSDVMATEFWYRASTPAFRAHLERALEICPDCDDVFTPLSHNDLYKIIEIRFVRYKDGAPQLSRVFKLIGVDSSGAMEAHALNDDWDLFGTLDGKTATAKWRMELSGLLSQHYWNSETSYIRLMPVLVRASRPAVLFQYYDGRFDRATAPGDPFDREYSHANADGQCIRDCHQQLCQAGRNVEGYYYVRNANCTCTLLQTKLTDLGDRHAQGRCEAWPNDVWATTPSSGPCTDN